MDEMSPMAERLPAIELDESRHRHILPDLRSQVRAPTLLIHGEDDGLIKQIHGQHSRASIPGLQMAAFPSGGPFPGRAH